MHKLISIFFTLFFIHSISFATTNQESIELNFLNELVQNQYVSPEHVPVIKKTLIDNAVDNVVKIESSELINTDTQESSFEVKSLFTVPNLFKLLGTLLFLFTFRGLLIIIIQKFGLIFGKVPMIVYQLIVLSGVIYLLFVPEIVTVIEKFWVILFASNALILVVGWIGFYYFHIVHKYFSFLKLNTSSGLLSLAVYYFIFAYIEQSFIFSSLFAIAFIASVGAFLFNRNFKEENFSIFSLFCSILCGIVFFLDKAQYSHFILPIIYITGVLSLITIVITFNPFAIISKNNIFWLLSTVGYIVLGMLSISYQYPLVLSFILSGVFISVSSYILKFALNVHVLLATGFSGLLLFVLANYFEQIIGFFKL